jgi:hypothetical protein
MDALPAMIALFLQRHPRQGRNAAAARTDHPHGHHSRRKGKEAW